MSFEDTPPVLANDHGSIQQAADLLELGMFPEALAAIQRLPADLREASAARRVLARAAACLGKWQLALAVARELRTGNEADRTEAARTLQSIAAEACKRGREEEARHLVGAAVLARPEQLAEILADERFPERFRLRLENGTGASSPVPGWQEGALRRKSG